MTRYRTNAGDTVDVYATTDAPLPFVAVVKFSSGGGGAQHAETREAATLAAQRMIENHRRDLAVWSGSKSPSSLRSIA